MKHILLSMIIAALALPAIAQTVVDGSAADLPAASLDKAVAEIAAEQVEPRSTQLRKLRHNRYLKILCGEYNARNRFGGYDEFRRFFSTPVETVTVPEVTHPFYGMRLKQVAQACD